MHRLPSVEQELAAHAQALRALARDLVGASDAEDLVQETALRALRSPPPEPRGLGAWLATILRRLAGNHRRAHLRRQRREGAANDAGEAPPADEAVMRRDSLRAVTQSLWNLPEPYQTTLVLRYFENLSPRAIAAETNTPLATVKSRLQRGLALLRQALDGRDEGRWRAVLLAATGTGPVAATITLTAGALLMTPAVKLLSGAAACAAAAILLWTVDWSGAGPPAPRGAEPVAAAAASADVVGIARDGAPSRESATAGAGADAAVDLAHPFAFELDCRVLDRDGLPVEGARVLVGPHACSLNTWPEATAADGRVRLHWRGKLPAMVVAIGTSRVDFAPSLQQVELRAAELRSLTLLGEATQTMRYRATEKKLAARSDGKVKAPAAAPQCQSDQPVAQDCRRCHADASYRGSFDSRLQVRQSLHPEATFGDLLLPAVKVPQTAEVTALKVKHLLADELRLAERVEVKTRSLPPATREALANVAPYLGTITGTVYGEDGKAVGGATVIWSQEPDRPRGRTRTDKDGRFVLEKVAPGQVEVRAGGGSQGLGRATRQVFAGKTENLDVTLQRGAVLRGTAVGADGAALEGWRVEYVAHDESWTDGVTVGKDGAFEFANLPGAGRLLLWDNDAPALPIAFEPSVMPDAGEVRFDLRARGAAGASVRLRALLPDGLDQAAAEVRIWQAATGRGATLKKQQDGAFELGSLCAGFYRLEVGGEAVGWLDLGQHWIDGLGLADLGSMRLQVPGTLRLSNRVAGDPVEVWLRRPDMDVRAEFEIGDRVELRVPAGKWVVLWGAPAVLRSREFTVGPGAIGELDLGAAGR